MSDRELWEQWCESTAPPVEYLKRGAKVRTVKDDQGVGRRVVTYPDEINGVKVIVEMPENAPTRSCDEDRHDDCPHRLGQPQEGGVYLKYGLYNGFLWRCDCFCHRQPFRVGRLF